MSVRVKPELIVRLLNTKMSALGPVVCVTFGMM
jgi:hypothetical protein